MKMFKKAIAVMLLVIMALLPVAGLAEEEETEEKSAFETLKALMEEQLSVDKPVEGATFTAVLTEDSADGKMHGTPDGILCQILFENMKDPKNPRKDLLDKETKKPTVDPENLKIIISARSEVPAEASEEESGESSDEGPEMQYEAVRYSGLTIEQMLYYAYIISSNYNTIQAKLPGETFSIVVKYGQDILLINSPEKAAEFANTVKESVAGLTGY